MIYDVVVGNYVGPDFYGTRPDFPGASPGFHGPGLSGGGDRGGTGVPGQLQGRARGEARLHRDRLPQQGLRQGPAVLQGGRGGSTGRGSDLFPCRVRSPSGRPACE